MTSFPTSNKKVFGLALIIAIAAIVSFIFLAKDTDFVGGGNIDSAVKQDVLDPNIVFDAPVQQASLVYIDKGKYASDTEDPKAVACGDAVIIKEIELGESEGLTKTDALSAVFNRLFDNGVFEGYKTTPGTLSGKSPYNALANANLSIRSISDTPGKYEIKFVGTVPNLDVCDRLRIKTQLEVTAGSVLGAGNATLYINNQTLTDFAQAK